MIPDLPGLEQEVLGRWASSQLPARVAARTACGPIWSLLGEPATATGVPNLAHLREQAVGDLHRRFRSMQGFSVRHRRGLASQGIDVEVAVGRELGLTSTAEVLSYGVESFVARCQESAQRHLASHVACAERLGCLTEPGEPAMAQNSSSTDVVWHRLRQFFDAGLIKEDYRVCSYCPRCRAQLAEHELRRPGVSARVAGLTVTVRLAVEQLPATAPAQLRGTELLVAAHSPWILAASSGIAVDPDRAYVLARRAGHDDRVVVAEDRFTRILGDGWHIAARFTGADLAGATCRAIWPPRGERPSAGRFLVRADSALATRSGTGIAPFAPRYGAGPLDAGDSDSAAQERADPGLTGKNSAKPEPIGPDGCLNPGLPGIGGLYFADAGPAIAEYLADHDALFASRDSVRRRPHCWRCGTLLLSSAMAGWYLKGSVSTGPGRQGDWLISRTGYFGSPLPIWQCRHRHLTCVSSLAELAELTGLGTAALDPRRPGIDSAEVTCRDCGGQARRVPETIDPAFDAAALCLDAEQPKDPAHVVATASSRTAGWLDALTSLSVIAGDAPAELTVAGRHDSRPAASAAGQRPGTFIEPWPLIERYGADAMRWHLAASVRTRSGMPEPELALRTVVRTVLLPYWNCVQLYLGYAHTQNTRAHQAAELAGQTRQAAELAAPPPRFRPALDRWLLSELQAVIADLTGALESARSDLATQRLVRFVAMVSRWYLRLWKPRFRPGSDKRDQAAALATLRECLLTVTRLAAPLMPFLSDHIWELLREPTAPDSVHLTSWPRPTEHLVDDMLSTEMSLVRQIVRAGRAARAAARIPMGQPLPAARIAANGFELLPADLRAIVISELNVGEVQPATAAVITALPDWIRAGTAACTVALSPTDNADLRPAGLANLAASSPKPEPPPPLALSHRPGS